MAQGPSIKISIRQHAPSALGGVKLKLVTISGKGGVGKSLVTAATAVGLAMRGYRVGVLDGDVYGPTIPKMLGMSNMSLKVDQRERIVPAVGPLGIKVVSIEFALPSEETAVIWRAPLVNQALRDFITQVDWGELDALLVDLPPGTGDAPLTVAQSLEGGLDGSIIVTIPTDIARRIVAKAIDFSRKLKIEVAGVVENMCCFRCKDGSTHYIFGRDAGRRIAEEAGVPFLGAIPMDPELSAHLDGGNLHGYMAKDAETARAILQVVARLEERYRHRLSQARPPAGGRSLLRLPGEGEEGSDVL